MGESIQKYQAFVETVRLGSFTRAAESLAYTQSAVSRMVADLEREWGVALLERGHGGVVPTRDGQALLPLVEGVCEANRRLGLRVGELRGIESGSICIGTFSSVATHILPEVIGRFQRDYPRIEFELLTGDYTEIERWALEGRIDLGVLPYEPRSAVLGSRELLQDELLAVVPEGHELASHESVTPADLARDPFILLERGEDDEVSPIFARAGVTPDVRYSTWDDYAIMSMVEQGLGLAILPALILRRNPYRVCCRPLAPRTFRQIRVVYRGVETLPAATRRFLDYLEG